MIFWFIMVVFCDAEYLILEYTAIVEIGEIFICTSYL